MPSQPNTMLMYVSADSTAVLNALNEANAFVKALGNQIVVGKINQVIYNAFRTSFMDYIDVMAKLSAASDPTGKGSFFHLYETGRVGDESARLFKIVVPQNVRSGAQSALFVRVQLLQDTSPTWIYGTKRGGAGEVYRRNAPPFRRKASVFEYGETINLHASESRPMIFFTDVINSRRNFDDVNRRFGTGRIYKLTHPVTIYTKDMSTYNRLEETMQVYLGSGIADKEMAATTELIDRRVIYHTIRRLIAKSEKSSAQSRGILNNIGNRRGMNVYWSAQQATQSAKEIYGRLGAAESRYVRMMEGELIKIMGWERQ